MTPSKPNNISRVEGIVKDALHLYGEIHRESAPGIVEYMLKMEDGCQDLWETWKQLSTARKDRLIRMAIRELRLKGMPIVSTSGREGYRLASKDRPNPNDYRDAQDYLAECRSRAFREYENYRMAKVMVENLRQSKLFRSDQL